MNLAGKNALVTGGGAGIGKGIALALAAAGAAVAVADIDEAGARSTAEDVRRASAPGFAYRVDIGEPASFAERIETIEREMGKIDILVNNAGVSLTKKVLALRLEDWDFVMRINARGTFFMSQAVYGRMRPRGRGRIINIASISGERPAKFSDPAYCASKAAILMTTKVFAKDASGTDITVNAVSPGYIATEMTRKIGTTISPDDVPIARLGTVDEISDAVLFLASEAGRYITGQNIRVNGGAYM